MKDNNPYGSEWYADRSLKSRKDNRRAFWRGFEKGYIRGHFIGIPVIAALWLGWWILK